MPLSIKQGDIIAFTRTTAYQALICDGAVRSGKTSIMTVAFVDWAMREFNNTNFAICGKTVGSAIKNIITPYMALTYSQERYTISFTRSDNKMIVRRGNKANTFYIYGGKDESSYMLIQGLTAAGILFDEVALLTRSFVEEAIARCLTFANRRYFFNCNPDSPMHWFYVEWILQAKKHKALRLQFKMQDNPALTAEAIEQAEKDFSGVFYQRKVLGEWVVAEGLVYPNFKDRNKTDHVPERGRFFISIDYGIVNPFSAHLWCIQGTTAYCINEYYFNSREKQRMRTDEEHYDAVDKLAGGRYIEHIIIDPSASSFKETVARHEKYNVRNAVNDVLNGISNCMTLLDTEYIKFNPRCENMLREFALYAWDSDSNKDEVIKENDHAMDDFRYFVNTILTNEFNYINWSKAVD